jgi:hypothetical protein
MLGTHNFSEHAKCPLLTAIGVGCFHFAFRSRTSDTIVYKAYLEQIKALLESLPAVGEVTIDNGRSVHDGELSVPETLSDIGDAVGCFPPLLYDTRIKFSLFIPRRVQQEVFSAHDRHPHTLTEQFRVQLIGSFHGLPVAFVEPQTPTGVPDPSNAVVLVREFLQKQMNQANTGNLTLQTLGPSPFHADIYLFDTSAEGRQSTAGRFNVTFVPQVGYDQILIGINLKEFDDLEDGIDTFIRESIDELGFFYSISQDQQARLTDWHLISTAVQELTQLLRSRGLSSSITRLYRSSNSINEVTMSLCEFQAACIERDQFTRQHYNDIYGPERPCPFFKQFIDKELELHQAYPVQELTELVRFAETRRTVTLQVLVNILVGILGGITGAVATLLLQK